MALSEGSKVPDFKLIDQNNKTISLDTLSGKPAVLYFYPKDETPGCSVEACEFRDINAEFPAVAARHIGWTQVALMCGHEMDVPDAQPRCIRVLVLLNTEKSQSDIQNVYLREAVNLRSRGINDN